MRAKQEGQIVCRSRSWSVKSEPQYAQAGASAERVPPHELQRTTAASRGVSRGTATTSPQRQRKRLPIASAVASNWRLHAGQHTRARTAWNLGIRARRRKLALS